MNSDQTQPVPQVLCRHSTLADPKSLVPRGDNPNQHDERQLEIIQKILIHQGWRAPIVVSKKSGKVVCGHGRLMAALAMNLLEVPVDEQEFASEEDEIAHMIADNRLASMAELDYEKVGDLLRELDASEVDLDLTCFADWEREPLLNAIWEAPEEKSDRDIPQNNSITLTTEQRAVFEQAASRLRDNEDDTEMSDGRCVELICADFLAGE